MAEPTGSQPTGTHSASTEPASAEPTGTHPSSTEPAGTDSAGAASTSNDRATRQSHDCPQCRAPMAYVPGTRTLQCSRWGGHQIEIAPATREIREHAYEQWQAEPLEPFDGATQHLACSGCGARSWSDQAASACALCAAALVADPQARPQIEPEAVLPFALSEQAAREVLQAWLSTRRFAPRRLRRVTEAEALKSTYLPYWIFGARTTSTYTGQRGRYYYTASTSTTTDAKGNTTTHYPTNQHTEWSDASGTVQHAFRNVLVEATRHLDPKVLAKVAPWPLAQAEPYQPEFRYGHRSVPYEIDVDQALGLAKAEMGGVIERLCKSDIGGDEQQVRTVHTSYADVTYKLVLFPAWIGSYRYGDKSWQILVNGSTGRVHGVRPYSILKIASTVAAILAAIAAIIALAVLNHHA